MEHILTLDQHSRLYESKDPALKETITLFQSQFTLIVTKTLDLIEQKTGTKNYEELRKWLRNEVMDINRTDPSVTNYIEELVKEDIPGDEPEDELNRFTIVLYIEYLLQNPDVRAEKGKEYSGEMKIVITK